MVSRRVVHKSIHGKKGLGAPMGNSNARKGLTLPNGLSLRTSDQILRFMREILVPHILDGTIGTRQGSAITTACKVLLDYESIEELEQRISQLEAVMKVVKN